eukprot:sb/3466501/
MMPPDDPPPELVDSDSSSDDENGSEDEDSSGVEEVDLSVEPKWPASLLPFLEGRPTRADFDKVLSVTHDKDGMFKPGTSWANSRGDLRDVNCRVMYVTETDPIMARPVSADHDKENGARAVSSNIKQQPKTSPPAPSQTSTKPAPSTAQKAPLATQKSSTSSQKTTPPVATAKQSPATTTKQSSSTTKPTTSSVPSPAEDKTSSKIQTKIDGEYGKAAAFFILTTKVVLFFLRQRTGGKSDEVLSIYFSTVEDTTEISSALQCLIRYTAISKRATPDLKDLFDGICALGVEAGKEIQPLLLPKSDKVMKESTSGKSSCSILSDCGMWAVFCETPDAL